MPPRESVDPRLAAALRRLREEHGLSQEAVAHRAGITTNAYSRIELGQANPTWTTVLRIAGALEMTIAQLALRAEDEERSR